VLYPTSDDLVWLYAVHGAELSRNFKLYQPAANALYKLLNKRELLAACEAVGIDTPQTRAPEDEAGVARAAREVSFSSSSHRPRSSSTPT
jgi:D-aspartate ligase